MKADFDTAAKNYDATFTHSVIGILQRNLVYQQLSKILKRNEPKAILEINCGTGEDAIWLAKQKYNVIATDISEEMIAEAKSKTKLENLSFQQADNTAISETFNDKKFDLIFSNFGGLNCLYPIQLEAFFDSASKILHPNGELFLVIMPKNTLWEQFYFLLKGKFSTIFRRVKVVSIANVDGEKVATYYYNPKDIVNLANTNFEMKLVRPVGFFVPPSYLESFFKNKPKLISFLNALEQKVKNQSWLSKFADHYIIVLQKK
ncbi:MAG: class I SAM-dependent methyltransferase [Bacteroidota bacterium]